MKTKYIFILFMSLFLLALTGCNAQSDRQEVSISSAMLGSEDQEAANVDLPDELTEKILSDWFNYLYVNEKMYDDMLWAFYYVEQFNQNRTWENLQLARMAVNTAERYITQREKPQETVITEEYDSLRKQGKDVSFIQPRLQSFAEERNEFLTDCQVLRMGLQDSVFWEDTLSGLMQDMELSKKSYNCTMGYLAVTTEYLLQVLGNVEQSEKFREFMGESCPRISSFQASGSDDELSQLTNKYLDEIENLETDRAKVVGAYQASLNRLADARERNDFSGFQDNAVEIRNLPVLFLMPDWYDVYESEDFYYWEASDGSHTYPKEGEDLTKIASGQIVSCPDVSREDFQVYLDLLESMKIYGKQLQDENGNLSAEYTFEEGSVRFIWSKESASINIKGAFDFAPAWYWFLCDE